MFWWRKIGMPLMIISCMILTSCGAMSGKVSRNRDGITELYRALESAKIQAEISADFPDRISKYKVLLDYHKNKESVISILEPQSVRDVKVRIKPDGSELSFDGAKLETGVVNSAGVTPLSALPTLIKIWGQGEASEVEPVRREGLDALLMVYRNGDMEYRTWFTLSDYNPIYAEVISNGRCVIRVQFEALNA